MNNPPNDKQNSISPARQKILDEAMEQLKKTRGEMDPSIFKKIRNIIAKNPKVMKALGLDELPNEGKKPTARAPKKAPIPEKTKQASPVNPKPDVNQAQPETEIIDQEKNLDIIAKFMSIKPSGKEGVKSLIAKSMKDK